MPQKTAGTYAPTLLTSRLRLRPMTIDDLDQLWRVTGNGDVMADYVDLADPSRGWSRERTAMFLADDAMSWQRHGFGAWGIELAHTTSPLIGYCGLSELTWLPPMQPAVELNFFLHPDYWGRGLGPEAVTHALDWAFAALPLESVIANVVRQNARSRRALEKLGLVYEQTQAYTSTESGRQVQFDVLRIASSSWRALRSADLTEAR